MREVEVGTESAEEEGLLDVLLAEVGSGWLRGLWN